MAFDLEHAAQISVGLRIVRLDSQRLAEAGGRLPELALSDADHAQIAVGRSIGGIQGESLAIMQLCFCELVQGSIGFAEVVVKLGDRGFYRNGSTDLLNRDVLLA